MNALDGAGHNFSLEHDAGGAPVPGFLHKVQGVNTAERAFTEIARHPAVLPLAQLLLGADSLDIFGTKFFPKLAPTAALPGGGISVNWHQDNFVSTNMGCCSILKVELVGCFF